MLLMENLAQDRRTFTTSVADAPSVFQMFRTLRQFKSLEERNSQQESLTSFSIFHYCLFMH